MEISPAAVVAAAAMMPWASGSLLAGRLAPGGGGGERGRQGQSCEGGAQPVEAFGDLGGPPPGAVDAQADLAGGAGELGGGVQDAVAEGGDLTAGQGGGVGEADELGPADQAGGGEHGFQPGAVFRPSAAGEVAQAGLLAFADAVFNPGVLAVAQLQPGRLPGNHAGSGVGEECGDAVPVHVGEGELRPGWGRSLRKISREPSGQEDRSIMPVASAAQAPSRRSSQASMAGCQHWGGIRFTMAWMRSPGPAPWGWPGRRAAAGRGPVVTPAPCPAP